MKGYPSKHNFVLLISIAAAVCVAAGLVVSHYAFVKPSQPEKGRRSDITSADGSVLPIKSGEYWYGLATDLGRIMPLSEVTIDLQTQNLNNQTGPLLISSKGRYIWSEGPFSCRISKGAINLAPKRGKIDIVEAGSTLKDAYLAACKSHFLPSGQIPAELFFSRPQYNTWIELVYDQNQADVLKYARGIVENGFPAGVLMIDDNWQKYYGSFEFKPDLFPDPKGMVDELHSLGFKVMLWISPFVSPDSREFRYLREKGYLVETPEGNAAMLNWWNGFSACYDLSNPKAYAYLKSVLNGMQKEYGIDGFKFDAGDPERYLPGAIEPFDGKSYDVEQTALWAKLGSEFEYNEMRACWKQQNLPLVQRLGDKDYSWNAVASLVPDMINAGLLGYAFTCPDMIGGGQFMSFRNVDEDKFDQALIVRSCEIHAMMPMMQFSVAPWRILNPENLAICRQYAKLHESMGEYILSQARHSAETGEPIVRHMEYAFPGQGFEKCSDQYMLGDQYLVAPMLTPGTGRRVSLPTGIWRDENGQEYEGGRTYRIEVPLDRLPRFEMVEPKTATP